MQELQYLTVYKLSLETGAIFTFAFLHSKNVLEGHLLVEFSLYVEFQSNSNTHAVTGRVEVHHYYISNSEID